MKEATTILTRAGTDRGRYIKRRKYTSIVTGIFPSRELLKLLDNAEGERENAYSNHKKGG